MQGNRQLLRLALHDVAHLRAVAEGVSVAEAAQCCLAVERASQAFAEHRSVVDRMAAVAHRRSDPRWRFLGVWLREPADGGPPALHAWAEAQGLADWPGAELQALYARRFEPPDAGSVRCQLHSARLRAERIAVCTVSAAFLKLDSCATASKAWRSPSSKLNAMGGWPCAEVMRIMHQYF